MTENLVFFKASNNQTILRKFQSRLNEIQPKSDFESARNTHMNNIINSMLAAPDEWDFKCGITIKWIGNTFIARISDENLMFTTEHLDDTFSMCFRFLLELYLSTKTELITELNNARNFAVENTNEFSPRAKAQVEYAVREMPISMLKDLLVSESIGSIKDFNNLHKIIKDKQDAWETELKNKEIRVEAIKASLATYESGFNFVGLFQGFDDLSKQKELEKNNLLFWIKVAGVAIVTPLISEIIYLYFHISNFEQIKIVLGISLLPTASLIAILVYFFRIILQNYKSTKSQLLQIELRKTLCRFIQHYADYSSKLKEKDKESLAKFESIIFSGIVSDDEKLPSTFDGIEQLGSLIKSLRA